MSDIEISFIDVKHQEVYPIENDAIENAEVIRDNTNALTVKDEDDVNLEEMILSDPERYEKIMQGNLNA